MKGTANKNQKPNNPTNKQNKQKHNIRRTVASIRRIDNYGLNDAFSRRPG